MIDDDVARARTLAADWYCDPARFERVKQRVFARSWQLCLDAAQVATPGRVAPVTLLPGCLDEPLLFSRDSAGLHCLSNVCTHRANLVVGEAGEAQSLLCRYHGRRFSLDGRFLSMPEFDGALDFPSERDHLPRASWASLGDLLFASIDPEVPFETLLSGVRERLVGVRWDGMTHDPAGDREFRVEANWALYCDNYLEGFHIPFVHPALSRGLDYSAYRTELYPWASLQVGVARAEDQLDVFAGGHVAAYYLWLFPNTMLNFYPWGLSLNVVQPLSVGVTRVLFRSYVHDKSRRVSHGAGADLDRVEHEDEQVVEQVQRGVRARLYQGGRYSPSRESGVHHFHKLLERALA